MEEITLILIENNSAMKDLQLSYQPFSAHRSHNVNVWPKFLFENKKGSLKVFPVSASPFSS